MEALLTGTPPGKGFCRDGKEAQQANSHDEMLEKLLCSIEKVQQLGIVSLERVRGKVERSTGFRHKRGVCCMIGEDGKIDGVLFLFPPVHGQFMEDWAIGSCFTGS